MKKSALVLSGVLAASVLGGAYFLVANKGADVKAYWDGETALNEVGKDGSLPLLRAVRAKDLPAVAALIENGADVKAKDKNGNSAVLIALESGDEALFEQLAQTGKIDFNQPEYLEKVIKNGNLGMVKALLAKGTDVNEVLAFNGRKRPDDALDYKDPRVITPLKLAVQENKAEIADVLLQNGAEGAVYFLSEEVQKASPEMVKALAKHAGNLRKITIKGLDLLAYVAGEAPIETLEFLLAENIGDVNKALLRTLMYRDSANDFDKAVDLFLQAGASPSADILELILKKNNRETFEKTAGCFANLNVNVGKDGESLLMYALRKGDTDTVAYLLERGADIWAEDKNSVTPMKTAVNLAKERADILQLFEGKLQDVNEVGYNGETLLMLYAASGNLEAFEKTAASGGNIWQKDNNGKTVLMYAAEGGNTKILDYLVFKGDNLNNLDNDGRSALMYAASAGKTKAVQYLVDKGVGIMATDNEGRTSLMYAAKGGYADIVNMLINQGESAAAMDNNERSVLMYAVKAGKMDVVDALLMKGVDVNHVDNKRTSVLSYAVQGGNADVVRKLINDSANVYTADVNGYLPLVYALKQGNAEMFHLLSVRGDIFNSVITKDNGKNLLIYAVEGENTELINERIASSRDLVNKKDNDGVTAMMLLAGYGRPETVRTAIDFHGNVRERDNNGKSALMYAAENSVGVTLISILKNVSSGEINWQDKSGKSALMYAVGFENNQPVKMHMLMRNGADAEAADKNGKTVLMYAVGNPYSRVDANAVAELVGRVRNIEVTDKTGKTALMYAAENPHADSSVIEVLLREKAAVNATDKKGKTVLMYAVESGDISKVRLLLANGAKNDAQTVDGKTAKDFINKDKLCFASAVEKLL